MKLEKPEIRAVRLARDIGVSDRTVNRRCQAGKIPAVNIGGGRWGITRKTYRICLTYGLDAFCDDRLLTKLEEDKANASV